MSTIVQPSSNLKSHHLNTNSIFYSTLLSTETMYKIVDWTIPGITVNHSEEYSRMGQMIIQGTQLEYSSLSVRVMLDQEMTLFKEVLSIMHKYQKPGSNQCEPYFGDSWIEVYSSKNEYLFKLVFKECYLKSFSNIDYMSTSNNEELSISLTLVYQYYTIE